MRPLNLKKQGAIFTGARDIAPTLSNQTPGLGAGAGYMLPESPPRFPTIN